jgi:hypothetical protein
MPTGAAGCFSDTILARCVCSAGPSSLAAMICRIPVSLLLSIPTNLVDVEKYSAPLYATVMAEYTRVPGDAFPPIRLDRLGRLNDGFRRLTAAVMRGDETILCEKW